MKILSSPLLLVLLLTFAETSAAEKIDINTASAQEIEKLTGIGPVLAQRIIDARPFYSVDELIKVKGIGEKKLADIKSEGLAWVDPNLQTQAEPVPEPAPVIEPTAPAATHLAEPEKVEQTTEPTKKGVAAAAEPLRREYSAPQAKKPVSVLLTAFAVSVLSGAVILILKNKLKNI